MPFRRDLYFQILGHLFFIFILFLSIRYYKERIIYIDSAFYITKVIQTALPNISGRYSNIFSQLLPLLAIKAGLPLKTVLILYSISFIFIFYAIFLFCTYKLKDTFSGIAIILVLCLCTRNSFYYAVTEMHQGLVFAVLFFATLINKSFNKEFNNRLLFIPALVIIICYYSHPTTFFLLLFSILFLVLEKKEYNNKNFLFLTVFILFLFLTKAIFTTETEAEGREYTQIKNFSEHIPEFFNLPAMIFLKGHSGNFTIIYVYAEILLAFLTIYYLQKKEFLKLLLIYSFVAIFIVINSVVYAKGDSGVVLEKSFLPLSFFVAIPFANDFLKNIKIKFWLIFFLVVLLIFFRVREISKTSKTYRNRIEYISTLLSQTKIYSGQKFLLDRKNLSDKIDVSWAFACETLLLSSLENPDSARTIYILNEDKISDIDTTNPNLFLCTPFWRNWDAASLNKKYFNLPEGKYQLME